MRLPAVILCLWCAVLLSSAAKPIVPQPAAPGAQYVTDPAAAEAAALGQAQKTVEAYETMIAAVGWAATILGGVLTAVKLAAAVPGPWQAPAQLVNSVLPGLAGMANRRMAAAAQQQAARNEQVALGLVTSIHEVLNVLPPEMREAAVKVLKAAQKDGGVREEVRALIGRLGLPSGGVVT